MKSGERLLLDKTRSDGSPDMDKVTRALMQLRNTPDSEYSGWTLERRENWLSERGS